MRSCLKQDFALVGGCRESIDDVFAEEIFVRFGYVRLQTQNSDMVSDTGGYSIQEQDQAYFDFRMFLINKRTDLIAIK